MLDNKKISIPSQFSKGKIDNWYTDFVFKLQFLNGRCVTALDLYHFKGNDYELKFVKREDAIRAARKLQQEFSYAGMDLPVLKIVWWSCFSQSDHYTEIIK